MPNTQPIHQQYAQAEGVQVWEGGLSGTTDTTMTPCLVIREDESAGGGCSAYWIGEVPLAFANVDMQDPLLAITCHATLRESKIATAAGRAKVQVGHEARGVEGVEDAVTANDIMGMRDVLAGLGESRFSGSIGVRNYADPESQLPFRHDAYKSPAIKPAKTLHQARHPQPWPDRNQRWSCANRTAASFPSTPPSSSRCARYRPRSPRRRTRTTAKA